MFRIREPTERKNWRIEKIEQKKQEKRKREIERGRERRSVVKGVRGERCVKGDESQ